MARMEKKSASLLRPSFSPSPPVAAGDDIEPVAVEVISRSRGTTLRINCDVNLGHRPPGEQIVVPTSAADLYSGEVLSPTDFLELWAENPDLRSIVKREAYSLAVEQRRARWH